MLLDQIQTAYRKVDQQMKANIRGISTACLLVTLTVLIIPIDVQPAGPIKAPRRGHALSVGPQCANN